MSITVVPPETLISAELSRKFNYPLVLRADHEEFYAIQGDITAYLYRLCANFPDRHVFGCAFEFGTYGESLLARIRSLRTMIFESQLYRYGAKEKRTEHTIHHEFSELYFPEDREWREKAIADCRQAFAGVLDAYRLANIVRKRL